MLRWDNGKLGIKLIPNYDFKIVIMHSLDNILYFGLRFTQNLKKMH